MLRKAAGVMLAGGLGLCLLMAARAERTGSGAVVLRADTRPPITLICPRPSVVESRVLGVAWDGRVWFAPKGEADDADHFQGSIQVISPKGAAKRIALFPRDVACVGGSLSPDGRYLAYAVHEEAIDGPPTREPPISVFIMRSDGTGKRRVAVTSFRGDSPARVHRISWSPDSRRVAFPVRVGGRNRIALVWARDGKKAYLPVPAWADVTGPDWSPDGKSIAYGCEDRRWQAARGEATDWTSFRWLIGLTGDPAAEAREYRKSVRPASIWVTELRSGKSRRLTKTPKTDVADLLPRWSPGGTQLVYARAAWYHEPGDMHYWWLDLRVVQADGTRDRAIKDPTDGSPASAAEGEVRWLPDGKRLVVLGCQEGAEGRATGLEMIDTDGTRAWPLTPGMAGWPAISRTDPTGLEYHDGLLIESFAITPDGRDAVASGALWGGDDAGLWRVPLPVGGTPLGGRSQ